MTERKLRSLLESTVTEHSQRCFHSPEFTVTSGMEEEASLLMSCPVSPSARFLRSTSAGLPAVTGAESPVTPGACVAVFPQTSLGVVLLLTPGNCRACSPHLNRGAGNLPRACPVQRLPLLTAEPATSRSCVEQLFG